MSDRPTPERFFETMNAYQRTAALKAAIELDLFTAIADGARIPSDIARRLQTSERGTRILCDFLTTIGFLTKEDAGYGLASDAALFLSKRSPAYLGATAEFLASPALLRNADELASTIRRGTVRPEADTVSPENPIWVRFARAMAPMAIPVAHAIATLVNAPSKTPSRVLDIAAGHGMFGIALAQRDPGVEVVAVDWPSVLAVAEDNAVKAGVADRYGTIPGDAFTVEFGTGFDLALITNFLHHFDATTCTGFLRKVAAALNPGGRAILLEFVPNPDRVSPSIPAQFSLAMLAGTAAGDAYTFDELRSMAEDAGFSGVAAHRLDMSPETVIVATKANASGPTTAR